MTFGIQNNITVKFSNGTNSVIQAKAGRRRLESTTQRQGADVLGIQGRWDRSPNVASSTAHWMHTGGFR